MPDTTVVEIPRDSFIVVHLDFNAIRAKWEVLLYENGDERQIGVGRTDDNISPEEAVFRSDVVTEKTYLAWRVTFFGPKADTHYKAVIDVRIGDKSLLSAPVKYEGDLKANGLDYEMDYVKLQLKQGAA